MLQVARLAPQLLRDSSDQVRDFVLAQLGDDGGFRDREGKSDLYYTIFGVESLLSLQAELPVERVSAYLDTFGDGKDLDLVHLASLARCLASIHGNALDPDRARAIRARLETFRTNDGGFANQPSRQVGTIYGVFLALGADQDTRVTGVDGNIVDAASLVPFLAARVCKDGGYSNEPAALIGGTPATAAAVAVQRNLQLTPPPGLGEWLTGHCFKQGGFSATARTPLPDLLSTATALHALDGLQVALTEIQEPCLDFVDSLWSSRGGFYGHWADDQLDCEYTFYGLLALGHLSL